MRQTMSYGAIANVFGLSNGTIHRIINDENYEPSKTEIRTKLGLPVMTSFICVSGEFISGAQTRGSLICVKCGAAFTSNAPKRKKCYTCTKYRKRRNEEM